MKTRKAKDLRELNSEELLSSLNEAQETFSKQRFQHALGQLQNTTYLNFLRKDIARMKTIINERQRVENNG
ncbi:MAG: 50S ribosomal protein L29 [Ignavibacteria bacterium]|jgi:large subunit ribosomal protein L29|nr:50S ribosomal protein L29 [Ignavibacteria bacterium]